MVTVMLQIAALAWVFVLPGTWIALRVGRDWPLPVRLAAGFTLGLLAVPLASFSAAWVLSQSVTSTLVIAVATVANTAGGAATWWLARRGKGGAE
ncbi:MAG: hypothetical protein ISR64_01905 [Deltaproteobacteria bacterium]|nr:hypothetical protein [Deltaproteobacteria bacterium]